ncbi:hypothetical protein Scep_009031 [Stephania cephalantha]|uniref:Ubiquitin-like protease family profile domain-containing protein n=1 Tax=Stephania cephalantha TaxID=152367 RepID=A0AAP0JUQ4_9MAGN
MGALTSNRKRGEDHFSLSYFSSPQNSLHSDIGTDFHVSKKPKFSYMNGSPERSIFANTVENPQQHSVIRRYPEPAPRFRRVVHAPCRTSRFAVSVSLGGESRGFDMGSFLSRRLEQAKNLAFGTFGDRRKDKAVTDVEAEWSKDLVSDDSSVQEVEILDDGRVEGTSVGSEHKSVQTGADAYLKEKYEKFADNRANETSSIVSDLTNNMLKVDEAGKMMELLSVNPLPPHKKLFESAERRKSRLDHLAFEIEFNEKKLSSLSKTAKKQEKEARGFAFTPLSAEEEDEVFSALDRSNRRRVLVTHENSNIDITGEILQCLQPGAWLNDEVINVYLELLKEREKREPAKFLKCHFFNTFFYKKLISGRGGYDFKAVRRWTSQRKIGYGLIECEKIFVPIHKDIHWCLAIINKKEEKFQYLDSLKGRDTQVLHVLARYFVDEVKDKCSKDIDVSSWKHEYVDDLPEQQNGSDCGVFMIKYADFYSRGLGLQFDQENMPYFRMRTAKEILRLKAE